MKKANKKRVTIEKLEELLDSEQEVPIQIMPDGRITTGKGKKSKIKPLTMREDLGGEYNFI